MYEILEQTLERADGLVNKGLYQEAKQSYGSVLNSIEHINKEQRSNMQKIGAGIGAFVGLLIPVVSFITFFIGMYFGWQAGTVFSKEVFQGTKYYPLYLRAAEGVLKCSQQSYD